MQNIQPIQLLDIYNIHVKTFIGRHVEYKGLKYLLEAEKLVKENCVFLIAGQGPMTDTYKKQYSSDRIFWLGKIRDEEMSIYYHAADIFAFPSVTRNEAFGVVLAESMCCGLPSVTFSVAGSGVNWVSINNETAIESENANSVQLANAITKLLLDNNLRTKLGVNAKKRVEKLFSKNIVAEKYRNLVESIMSKTNQ